MFMRVVLRCAHQLRPPFEWRAQHLSLQECRAKGDLHVDGWIRSSGPDRRRTGEKPDRDERVEDHASER